MEKRRASYFNGPCHLFDRLDQTFMRCVRMSSDTATLRPIQPGSPALCRSAAIPPWRITPSAHPPYALREAVREPQLNGGGGKFLVERPQKSVSGQARRSKQMSIHVTDPAAKQPVSFDKLQDFFMRSEARLRHEPKICQDDISIPKISQCEFANDKGVRQNLARFEQCRQGSNFAANVLRPNRGVDQDHLDFSRRRRPATKPGWLPPKRANRRAASRSTSNLSA